MAYVVLGAGAVGGTLGFRLAEAGHDVLFIARGKHGEVIRQRGLTLRSPAGTDTMPVRVISSVVDYTFEPGDRLLLCVKSQDVDQALAGLDRRLPIFCFQNGVVSEPAAAHSFDKVYGAMTWIPSLHLEPGVVEVYSDNPGGSFRLGCYPSGEDDCSRSVASDLVGAGFEVVSVPDVMRWKYSKLLLNLGNAVDAFGVPDPEFRELVQCAMAEGRSCLAAAGIDYLPTDDLLAAVKQGPQPGQTVDGGSREGGSTWQSASRGQPLETDHLNGWIVELGSECGVATPVNRALVQLSNLAEQPRSVAIGQVREWVEDC